MISPPPPPPACNSALLLLHAPFVSVARQNEVVQSYSCTQDDLNISGRRSNFHFPRRVVCAVCVMCATSLFSRPLVMEIRQKKARLGNTRSSLHQFSFHSESEYVHTMCVCLCVTVY